MKYKYTPEIQQLKYEKFDILKKRGAIYRHIQYMSYSDNQESLYNTVFCWLMGDELAVLKGFDLFSP